MAKTKEKRIDIFKEMERRRKEHVRAAVKLKAARDAAMLKIREKYGIAPLAGSRAKNILTIPSGHQRLDDLLTGTTDKTHETVEGSGGGWPRGRIIEIYGPESCGKTTMTLEIIKAAQTAGLRCAFIDAEHALHAGYAAKIGVDLDALEFEQPSSAEEAFDLGIDLAKAQAVDVIVIDSVSALEPEAEDEEDMKKSSVALQARLMSKGLRKLVKHVSDAGILMVFVNQTRKKIGVRFGNPNTTSGGNALRFYASIRLDMVRVKTLKKGDKKFGIRTKVQTVKNKVAPPFREVHIDIHNKVGIAEVHGDFIPGGKGSSGGDDDDE